MKPTVTVRKDARNRTIGHEATIGPITGNGPDRKHAAEACEFQMLEALERLKQGAYIGLWQGHTYVVQPTINGWAYWIEPFSRRDYFCEHGGTRDAAIDSACKHLAQTVWTLDCPDDVQFCNGLPYNVRPELITYFKWQREYRRLTVAGYSDTDARNIIGGFRAEDATI